MRTLLPILAIAISTPWLPVSACSCFGPDTFCGTLDPPYEEPEWWIPDAVVLAVPLETFYYGIDVVIIQIFDGEVNNDTVRVWGDNGALCRQYAGWAPGDTLVLGLHRTDLSGNVINNPEYPEGLEQPEDYMVSACGVYVLDYVNGSVHGWITAPQTQTFTLQEFEQVVQNCSLTNGLFTPAPVDPFVVRNAGGVPVLEFPNTFGTVDLSIVDLQGRCVVRREWNGAALALDALVTGVYLVDIRRNDDRWVRRVVRE